MKKLIYLSIFVLLLLNAAVVFAQTLEAEQLLTLDFEDPVQRMVWNETGDVLTLVSKSAVKRVSVTDTQEPQTYDIGGKSWNFSTVSEAGVVAVLSEDWDAIYLYDPEAPEKAMQVIEPGFRILSVCVSKDGSQVLADSADQIRTVVYSTEDGSETYDLTGFSTAAPVYDSTLSADGNYVTWHSRGTFAVQKVADQSFGSTISLWDFASGYELSPDSSALAVGMINDDYENGAVLFFEPETGRELGRTILGETAPSFLSYSDDGSVLWAADAKTVYSIDPVSFEVTSETAAADENDDESRIWRIASAPDGQSAAVLLKGGELSLIRK